MVDQLFGLSGDPSPLAALSGRQLSWSMAFSKIYVLRCDLRKPHFGKDSEGSRHENDVAAATARR